MPAGDLAAVLDVGGEPRHRGLGRGREDERGPRCVVHRGAPRCTTARASARRGSGSVPAGSSRPRSRSISTRRRARRCAPSGRRRSIDSRTRSSSARDPLSAAAASAWSSAAAPAPSPGWSSLSRSPRTRCSSGARYSSSVSAASCSAWSIVVSASVVRPTALIGQRQSEPELREVRRRSRRPPCAQAVLDRRDGVGIAAEALGDLEVRHPGRQPAREAELPGHLDHATGVLGRDAGLPGDVEQLRGERVGVGAREMRRRAIQRLGRRDRVADRGPGGGEVAEQPLRHGQIGAGADARVMGEQRVGRIPPPAPLQKRDRLGGPAQPLELVAEHGARRQGGAIVLQGDGPVEERLRGLQGRRRVARHVVVGPQSVEAGDLELGVARDREPSQPVVGRRDLRRRVAVGGEQAGREAALGLHPEVVQVTVELRQVAQDQFERLDRLDVRRDRRLPQRRAHPQRDGRFELAGPLVVMGALLGVVVVRGSSTPATPSRTGGAARGGARGAGRRRPRHEAACGGSRTAATKVNERRMPARASTSNCPSPRAGRARPRRRRAPAATGGPARQGPRRRPARSGPSPGGPPAGR